MMSLSLFAFTECQIHHCSPMVDDVDIRHYIVSILIIYGYIRFLVHAVTKKMMLQWSPSFRAMSHGLQDDTAWNMANGTTIFLVLPVTLYGCLQIFLTGDPQTFNEKYGASLLVVGAYYSLDNLMHLVVNNFSNEHLLLHHVVELIIVLYAAEWSQGTIGNHGWIFYFTGGEALSSKMNFPILSSYRLAKCFLRDASSYTGQDATGLDRLFILSTPKAMAGRLTVMKQLYIWPHNLLPLAACILYALRINGVSTYWKVMNVVVCVLFAVIDRKAIRFASRVSRAEYWEVDLFLYRQKQQQQGEKQGPVSSLSSCRPGMMRSSSSQSLSTSSLSSVDTGFVGSSASLEFDADESKAKVE